MQILCLLQTSGLQSDDKGCEEEKESMSHFGYLQDDLF